MSVCGAGFFAASGWAPPLRSGVRSRASDRSRKRHPRFSSMRRWRFDKVQLVTLSEISCPLGTINSELLKSRMMLARIPIRRMTPISLWTCTTSPTFTGRSKSRISPETKLFTMFCKPKPIPTPSAPARTVNFVMSTPRAAIATKNPSEQNDVMQERRDGVGRSAIKMEPIVNILLEKEADEAREQRRDPDREDEGENGAEGDME